MARSPVASDERAVTLTATFSLDGATAAREFAVTVLAADAGRIGGYIRTGDTTRTDVLHLATSADGATYAPLNNGRGVLYPILGRRSSVRPTHLPHPTGTFGLVATDNSAGTRIHVFDSTDLVQYTNERLVTFAPRRQSNASACRCRVRQRTRCLRADLRRTPATGSATRCRRATSCHSPLPR